MSDRETLQDLARQCLIIEGNITELMEELEKMTKTLKEIYTRIIEALDGID